MERSATVRRSTPLIVLAFVALASPALPQPAGDLVARVSQAYATYCDQLQKEGRADELTMRADEKLTAIEVWYGPQDSSWTPAGLRWFGPKDSTWTQVDRRVRFPDSGLVGCFPGGLGGENLNPRLPSRDVNEDCQNFVAARFQVASQESVLFTMGHVVEGCSDTPWMAIRLDKKTSKHVLPDIFGYNVQGLWYTPTYLILNIRVEYEYGATYEGLAFWDLDKGWIRSVVAETQAGVSWGDEPPRTDPTQGLGVLLRGLSNSKIGEMERAVYVNSGKAELVFWPQTQEWMALP